MSVAERRNILNLGAACAAVAMAGMLALGAAQAAESPPVQRLGVFSLLGNSVRVVARQTDEVMFKDVGMDDLALNGAQAELQARLPQAQLSLYRAPEQVNVDDQLSIGTAAGRRGVLPDWILRQARADGLSHVLLITSSTGPMEFRTGRTQVVGNYTVTGIGFYVSADGRTTNVSTGAVANGYLAPFVQLRLTLVDVANSSLVNTVTLSEGFIVGPPEKEAPDPWRFMTRADKAASLQDLLKTNIPRGIASLLKPR